MWILTWGIRCGKSFPLCFLYYRKSTHDFLFMTGVLGNSCRFRLGWEIAGSSEWRKSCGDFGCSVWSLRFSSHRIVVYFWEWTRDQNFTVFLVLIVRTKLYRIFLNFFNYVYILPPVPYVTCLHRIVRYFPVWHAFTELYSISWIMWIIPPFSLHDIFPWW